MKLKRLNFFNIFNSPLFKYMIASFDRDKSIIVSYADIFAIYRITIFLLIGLWLEIKYSGKFYVITDEPIVGMAGEKRDTFNYNVPFCIHIYYKIDQAVNFII